MQPSAPPPVEPDEDDRGPSKSQRKRDMQALQTLGERLVDLPPTQLARLVLPVNLLDAIQLARRITAHEGRRRQLQYIGKLMRHVDAESIRAALSVDDEQHRAKVARMHAAEHWRDRLIASPDQLDVFIQRYPTSARTLHPLLRAARTEQARQQRGRHYRELYRALLDALEPTDPSTHSEASPP